MENQTQYLVRCVRVGLYIPPSEIISLIAFHFLGVSFNSFICIPLGACHYLTEGLCHTFSLMFVPVGLVEIYQNSLKLISAIYSHRWYCCQTRVIGLGFGLQNVKQCPQAMRMFSISFQFKIFIINKAKGYFFFKARF